VRVSRGLSEGSEGVWRARALETPSQVRPSKDQKQTINKLNIPIPTCSPGAGGSIKDLEFNNLPGSELIKNTNSGMI